MRILVTGGAGFIGSHIVTAVLDAGHEVAVLDNLATGLRQNVPAGVPIYAVDVRDRVATLDVVKDFRPQVVNHHAAQASVSVSMREPDLDVAVNVLGGLNVLDACLRNDVERFVFASTGGALYGEVPEGTRATEATPVHPKSPYAVSKQAFEQLLEIQAAHHQLTSAILRYANVYGPRQDPHGEAGAVAIFFERALRGAALLVNGRKTAGDPGCVRDYVAVADVVRANLLAMDGALDSTVLNVGTGVPTTTRQLAEAISSIVGGHVAIDGAPPRPGDVERSVLDPSRCEKRLGPLTKLSDGLDATAQWYRSTKTERR
jgi:UDP-glucose 4-epimerase